MGIRGELFSTRVMLENRTYFFNVKENRMGDLYLNIVESKNREASSGFDRQSVILFADDLQDFLKGFDESLRVMEKAVREQKKAGSFKAPRGGGRDDRDRGREGQRGAYEHGGEREHGRRERGGGREYENYNNQGRKEYEHGARQSSQSRTGPAGSEEKAGAKRPRRMVVRKSKEN